MVIDFNPVIFSLGPLQARWYGLMYVIGFVIGSRILIKLSREKFLDIPAEKVDSFVLLLIAGMFVGARLTYMLVYGLDDLMSDPMEIFAVWHGGLSFHGGVLGFALVCWLYARAQKIPFYNIADGVALAATQGFFFGRIGNFINGELWGRVTDLPWGMVFSRTGGPYPRHPSQLYEAIGEGIILTLILWILKSKIKNRKLGFLTGAFLLGYGLIRYSIEFFREPDAQMGYYLGGTTTMGQMLCSLMIIFGIIIIVSLKRRSGGQQ
ncbi:MAG: prolipoprotein diacylglyceryl transferase [Oligoflexia bacterium]|nr:prolipoprotein diacylglyceryl transferase [Oligoflexia bacterium]